MGSDSGRFYGNIMKEGAGPSRQMRSTGHSDGQSRLLSQLPPSHITDNNRDKFCGCGSLGMPQLSWENTPSPYYYFGVVLGFLFVCFEIIKHATYRKCTNQTCMTNQIQDCAASPVWPPPRTPPPRPLASSLPKAPTSSLAFCSR